MIERYSTPEISTIWSEENKFQIWYQIELFALEQMAREKTVPMKAFEDLRDHGRFDLQRISELEGEVKHDVIAFLTNLAENVGVESRSIHRGMTSNDVLDTTLAYQLKCSGEFILNELKEVLDILSEKADQWKTVPCMGRSHGVHAEPITFGLKLLSWLEELKRQHRRLALEIEQVAYGKLAGPVGTYTKVEPTVEAYVMERLGLKPETIATQVVPRDRHAGFFCALAQLGSSIERCVTNIRLMQMTEVEEVLEGTTSGQKGSSAMPHKKNPILSENLTGIARLLRGYALSALESVPLWHERDISHSSVERVIGPDASQLAHFMVRRLKSILQNLVIREDRMGEIIAQSNGQYVSGSLLIALVDAGMLREDAYKIIQQHAFAARAGGASVKRRIAQDTRIQKVLSEDVLERELAMDNFQKHVDTIFSRATNTQDLTSAARDC